MQYILTSIGGAILLFLCAILGFRWGLRLGMQAAKGQAPPKLEIVKKVKEAVIPPKPDPVTTEMLRGYANMMAHDGYLPGEKVK